MPLREWKKHLADGFEIMASKDKRGVNLISDALPFGRLWYDGPKAVRERNRVREVLQSLT